MLKTYRMARLLLVLLAIFAFGVVTQGQSPDDEEEVEEAVEEEEEEEEKAKAVWKEGKDMKLRREKLKSCGWRRKIFERCLKKGYKSRVGCVSAEVGTLKKRSWRRCRRLENKLARKCDYVCEKPFAKTSEYCWRNGTSVLGDLLHYRSVATFEDCYNVCHIDPECESFTFYNDGNKDCVTFTNMTGFDVKPTDFEGIVETKLKSCDRSELDTSCKEEGVGYTDDPTFTLNGVESLQDCAMFCRDTRSCKSFSSDGENCYLYDRTMELGQEDLRWPAENFNSMNIDCGAL